MFERYKTIWTIILFFILLFVFAKWGPAINFATTTQSRGEPLVVSGEGKVFVTPDIAKVNFGIQSSGGSLKLTQDDNSKKSKTLTDALKKLGIKEADIKTTSYSVYPQYDFTNPNQKITGFQVSINYEVTIRDFDKVNDAIVAGTTAGANLIGGINFEVNDATKKEKLNEARKLAVNDAKQKAQGLAGASGISLGKIINISENQNRPTPIFQAADGAALEQKAPTPPNIQPGQTEIDVTISLSYEVR